MGIGAFGQKRALWMDSLQKKVDEIDSFDESEPGFISAGRLRGWLGDIELFHSPKNRFKLQNDKNVSLKHLTILYEGTSNDCLPILLRGSSHGCVIPSWSWQPRLRWRDLFNWIGKFILFDRIFYLCLN